jgi:hypothetical protein
LLRYACLHFIRLQFPYIIISSIGYLAYLAITTNNITSNSSNNNGYFRNISIILASFIRIKTNYSIAAIGFRLLAKGMLEPLSFVILLFFVVIYLIDKVNAKSMK